VRGAFIPLEFADAAYRYGHSPIRHRYQLNLQTDPVPLFPDLLGFHAVPRERTIDWRPFFDTPARHRHSGRRKSTESWREHSSRCQRQLPVSARLTTIILSPSVTYNAAKASGSRLVKPWPAHGNHPAHRGAGWHCLFGLAG